ncbi:hypothetical protein BDE02_16G113700, partial [Populus trichocarpa]
IGKDTLTNIITCRTNADMERQGILLIASINITKNIIKILLQEGEGINVFGFNPKKKKFQIFWEHGLNRVPKHALSLNLKSISHSGLRIYSNYLQIL